jgi:hypothetical protein
LHPPLAGRHATLSIVHFHLIWQRDRAMKNTQCIRQAAAWLALCGMWLPAPLARGGDVVAPTAAIAAVPSKVSIHDVALRPGGLLVGQLVDKAMQPMRNVPVAIHANGQAAAATTTDANGVFAVAGLRGGVHQIVAGESIETCRLWAAGTAPPQAASNLRLVPGQGRVVRGQWGPPPAYSTLQAWATNPWVIGGVVATAIAVPVVLNNIDDDDDNGS